MFSLALSYCTLSRKLWKEYWYFCCAGLLQSSRPVHLDANNCTHFTQILDLNRVSWLPASKHNRKLLKNSENEITVEKRMSYVSRGLKVKERRQKSSKILEGECFGHYLIKITSISQIIMIKNNLVAILSSLTLSLRCCFFFFWKLWKIQVVSLNCFATQLQANTFRRQKLNPKFQSSKPN